MGFTAAVLGASGYSGGELLRLLVGHPALTPVAVAAGAGAGRAVADLHPHLAALDLVLGGAAEVAGAEVDVCFACMPSGALRELEPPAARVTVDLSDDFRVPGSGWVYGLTELARGAVARSTRIANPGCYPTGALLCLVPFVRRGLVQGPVVIDALSGVSGAGRKPDDHLLFASLHGTATAYGPTEHRHVGEIERGLASFGGRELSVSFTPHLVPMARGLLVTARAPLTRSMNDGEALEVLSAAYAGEPFVRVVRGWPGTKAAAGTNLAIVSARVDGRNGFLVCSAALDNLGKGAAGQAVQNANVALGVEEIAGLARVGLSP